MLTGPTTPPLTGAEKPCPECHRYFLYHYVSETFPGDGPGAPHRCNGPKLFLTCCTLTLGRGLRQQAEQRKLNPSAKAILGPPWYQKGSFFLRVLRLKILRPHWCGWELAGLTVRPPDSPGACNLLCTKCRAVRSSDQMNLAWEGRGHLSPRFGSVRISNRFYPTG